LKNLFATMMKETAPKYLPFTKGFDDKAKEKAIQHFEDKKTREEFYKFFRQLQNLHEIISPDAFMRPYLVDFEGLTQLYELIRNAYSTRPYIDKELTDKTRKLLRERTALPNLQPPGAIHELGPTELAALKDNAIADTTKILNLKKALAVTIANESGTKPFLASIAERAEVLEALYEDRQKTTEEALAAFVELAEEYIRAEATRRNMGVDENTFAIYTSLRTLNEDITSDQSKAINAIFEKYPDFRWNKEQERQLRQDLYKELRSI